MKIREERAGETGVIRRLLVGVFGQETEADLVDALRAEGVVAQALVAEDAGEIIGFLMLSRLEAPFPACALAPLAVDPLWQRHGIGTALIGAMETECDAVFVLGDPDYYGRFGFRADLAAGYACAFAGPYFLVRPHADIPATGQIFYPRAFAH